MKFFQAIVPIALIFLTEFQAKVQSACPERSRECKKDGICIPIEWFCDGDADCSEGEDEKNCLEKKQSLEQKTIIRDYFPFPFPKPPTPVTKPPFPFRKSPSPFSKPPLIFLTPNSDRNGPIKLPLNVPNLGKNESIDTKRVITSPIQEPLNRLCSKETFYCDKACVPIEFKCNGVIDCSDGVDERYCSELTRQKPNEPLTNECKLNEKRCLTGECIDTAKLCDGSVNCPNGEDEFACDSDVEFTVKQEPWVDCLKKCLSNEVTYGLPGYKFINSPSTELPTTTSQSNNVCPNGFTLVHEKCVSDENINLPYKYIIDSPSSTELPTTTSQSNNVCPNGFTLVHKKCVSDENINWSYKYIDWPSSTEPPTIARKVCPNGFKLVHEKCVKIYTSPTLTWHEAEQACRALDAELVEIESIDFFTNLTANLNHTDNENEDLTRHSFWIGAVVHPKLKLWVWSGSNQALDKNHPLQTFEEAKIGQCGILKGCPATKIESVDCEEKHGTICQRKKETVPILDW